MHRKCCKRECCPRQKKTRQLRDPCYGYICLLSTWSPRWVQAIYIGWVKHLLKDAIPRCEMPKGSLEGSTCICLLQMKSLLVGKGILMNSGHTSSHEDFKLPTTCAPAGRFTVNTYTLPPALPLGGPRHSPARTCLFQHTDGSSRDPSNENPTGREVDDTADKAYLGISQDWGDTSSVLCSRSLGSEMS